MDRVASSGSCTRCQRSLGLAALKLRDHWYCSMACAEGDPDPADRPAPAVAEAALYPRPRRHFRNRLPKELKASAVRRTPPGGAGAAGTG
jgi:hypothetical protein